MEYLPFGEILVDEHLNSYNTPYKFNGKELDAETGNYYYGARYYNPKWSVWLSVDPLAEQMPSWSSYNYTFSNPIKFTDPTGMAPEIVDPPKNKGCCDNLKKAINNFKSWMSDAIGWNGRASSTYNQEQRDRTEQARKEWAVMGATAEKMWEAEKEVASYIPGGSAATSLLEGDFKGAATNASVDISLAGLGSIVKVGGNAAAKLSITGFNALVKQLPKAGQQNVRILQNWAKSKGFVKGPNSGGPQVWGVYDNAGNFSWRLKIKAQGSMRQGLEAGSSVPRFDARLGPGNYVNPFTGQTGGKVIGDHLPLY